ncbi:hypothetical protein [Haloarcula salinisoli]|uniref:Uncharacterized protein n=1 Tax=Haloarcula salinisoli TaxID=2487746 RepID=A0A8J7YIL2_9EURY|nr:hypothetical protein [Halomicroarcula salinisoli]MBX0286695.1 hypothetical protein [Halomicroarcula salinisoli]MBX0304006.1 hypothetical protein [Halomicroarcula salinisoli]
MKGTRRQYLMALAGSGVAGVAGCSGGGTDTPTGGTETRTETETAQPTETEAPTSTPTEDDSSGSQQSMAVPRWTSWVPADLVVADGYEVHAADVQRLRSDFPSDSDWNRAIQQRASGFGVDAADMTDMIEIVDSGGSTTVITGTFDPEAVRSHLGFSSSQTDSYQAFTVLGDSTAIGETALVQGQYRSVLDTRFDSNPALGTTDDDWRPLLSTLTGGTLVTAKPGYDGNASFSTTPLRHGFVINAGSDGGSVLTEQFLFASQSQATTVYDSDRETLSQQLERTERTVRRLEQQGRRIVIVTEQDTFDI